MQSAVCVLHWPDRNIRSRLLAYRTRQSMHRWISIFGEQYLCQKPAAKPAGIENRRVFLGRDGNCSRPQIPFHRPAEPYRAKAPPAKRWEKGYGDEIKFSRHFPRNLQERGILIFGMFSLRQRFLTCLKSHLCPVPTNGTETFLNCTLTNSK